MNNVVSEDNGCILLSQTMVSHSNYNNTYPLLCISQYCSWVNTGDTIKTFLIFSNKHFQPQSCNYRYGTPQNPTQDTHDGNQESIPLQMYSQQPSTDHPTEQL